MTYKLVEIEATPEGTVIEVLRVVEPKNVFEPVRTRIVEWLDERCFRDAELSGDPLEVREERGGGRGGNVLR